MSDFISKSFNIISFPADVGGCGHYRMLFPAWALRTIRRDIRFIESFKLIIYPEFFRDLRVIRLQRQVNDAQAKYFLDFLVPVSKSQGQWIIYEIDDVIGYEDIPAYNVAKSAFNNKKFFDNVKNMLTAADFITVTTESLKMYYVNKYQIEADKIIVIPNYLPRWWIGETYNNDRQVKQYEEHLSRPRIGLPLSSSHYDVKSQNNHQDDLTHINDFIRSTCRKYEWVFVGHVPKQLEDLLRDKKISLEPGSDLLNYPRELWRRNLQCIVAPLQDNTFNKCKSNIKLIEAWSLGIPCIAQNLEPYSKYTDLTFNDPNALQNKLDYLFSDRSRYKKIIKDNRHVIDYGDHNSQNGWWLEKNLTKWMEIYTIPQKTLGFDLELVKQHLHRKEEGIKLDLGEE